MLEDWRVKGKNPVVQDILNNMIALTEIPSWAADQDGGVDELFHSRDRNGKLFRHWYTTFRVEKASMNYVESCERANGAVVSRSPSSWKIWEGGRVRETR